MKSIEASLEINFGDLVDNMGKLAWTCILNQFITVLVGKQPMFLQPNHYVYMTVGGAAHMNVGYKPNFDNPDPAGFPKIQFTMTGADRQPSTGPDQTPPRTPPPP